MLFACPSLPGQVLLPQLKRAAATEALNNARQIGLALIEFEAEYGSFPTAETRKKVEEATGAKLPADDNTSNSVFRQLIAAGIAGNEALFFAKIPGAKKGDNDAGAGKMLAKGENGFAYIAGLGTTGNPTRPLVVCPLVAGTANFDPKPFGGKALVLRIDGSVQMLPIGADGKVLVEGVELLSKDHPVWAGKAPDIRHPDLLPAGG